MISKSFKTLREKMSPEARARQNLYRRSILDFISDDTRKPESDLGPTDRRKLDDYIESIRDVERRIQIAMRNRPKDLPAAARPAGFAKARARALLSSS